MSKKVLTSLILMIVILSGLGATAWYRQSQGNSGKNDETVLERDDTDATPTVPKTYPVKVYFSKHPESDNDPTKVYAFNRNAPTVAMGSFVVNELLTGPTEAEAKQGYFTPVVLRSGESNCGAKDFMLAITDSKATLRFCKDFDSTGVMADGRAQEVIRASLMQFDSVDKVVILNKDGNCLFDASGQNLCLN